MVIGGILAGGTGSRMGHSDVPKQFLPLSGKPMVVHVVEKFLACPEMEAVVVGVHRDWLQYMRDLKKKHFPGREEVVITEGGADRNGTIHNLIEAARERFSLSADDVVVTHDAVRPFVSLRIIEDNIEAAREYGVCDTVIPATDTIVRSADGRFISDIPVRPEMFQGQTPQSFTVGNFDDVYRSMSPEELEIVTDACKMFHLRGYQVRLVTGDISNLKITLPFDYKMACVMMEAAQHD